jgi:predicted enzyme related to lactoylglutathione lyase
VTDPFAALRVTDVPLDPDPDFAARLRVRLERALALPRGVAPMAATVTTTSTTLTPYLAVADARAAIDWYTRVFGATAVGDPIVMPDGRVGHAELDLGGAHLYLSDAHPEIGVVAPDPDAGTSITLHLELADVDAVTDRARAEAGVIEREPSDNPYGRIATVRDPFGHRWMLNGPVSASRHITGDVGYFALWVEDVSRAADFYATVLGWTYVDSDGPRREIAGAPYRTELASLAQMRAQAWPDRTTPTAFCAFEVADLSAAAERIRAAGGTAQPGHNDVLDCTDNQGLPFSVYVWDEMPANDELAYLTVDEPSIDAAEAFYEAVFGWTFRGGSVPEGRQVDGPTPMTGFRGGAAEPAIVPMFAVDDIGAAVERVRAAGGTATDPERQPYGTTSDCTDDQGLRFYLGELT